MPLRHKLPRRTSAALLARSAKTPTKKVDQPAAFHPELSVELKPFSSLSVNVFQRKPLHPLALLLTCILIALAFLFPRPTHAQQSAALASPDQQQAASNAAPAASRIRA